MTIRRAKATSTTDLPAPRQKPTSVAARVLTDDDVATILKGTWKYNDGLGSVFVTFTADGKFSTVRSISDKDLIFDDYMGRVAQAAKVR